MFVDLVASTRLARAMTSDEYFDLMGEMLRVLAAEVEAVGGHVVQFQGDAVLASFGAPCTHDDDALRAVRAAHACLRAVEAYGSRVGLRLHARAGVASGTATAGWVGREYTVYGTVVNLSRRLCSLARSGEVLVSEATRNETWTRADHEVAVGLSVPDYADERGPYRLLGFKPARREPGSHSSPFVGRQAQLVGLASRMQGVRSQGGARRVDVVGSLGSGKSRLISEFARRQSDAWTVSVGPGQGLAEVLKQALPPDALLNPESLGAHLRKAGALDALDGAARCLGMAPSTPFKRESDLWAVEQVLSARSRREPLILVLERASVLEPDLAELGDRVLARARALILRESTVRPPGADAVELEPLNHDESLALLEISGGPMEPAVAAALIERAGGNPLLLELLGRALSDGRLSPDGMVEDSAQRVLLARLDRLPLAAREALSAASLSPLGFWHGGLEAVLGRGCDEALSMLLDDGWVAPLEARAAGSPACESPEYAVPLELVRASGYQLLPPHSRRAAHVRLGVWLRGRAPELAAEQFRLAGSGMHELVVA